MVKRRSESASPEAPKRQKLDEDVEEGLLDFEKEPRQGQSWLQAAKKATALPVRAGSDWQANQRPVAEEEAQQEILLEKEIDIIKQRRAEKKAKRRQERQAKQERKDKASAQFKSPHITMAQRMELQDKYAQMMSSTLMLREVIAECSEMINTDEHGNLYRLNLLLVALTRLMQQVEQVSNDEAEKLTRSKLALLVFLSVGVILKNLLPGYKIITDHSELTEKTADGKVKKRVGKDTLKLWKFESHLLDCYDSFLKNALFPMAKNRFWLSGPLAPKFVGFIADFLTCARFTNFNSEYVAKLVESACLIESRSLADTITKAVGQIFYEDSTLSLSAHVVPVLVTTVSNHKRKQGSEEYIHCPPALPGLIRALGRIEIGKKEREAEKELQRSGINNFRDLSRSRDKDEKKLDEELMKTVSAGLIHGDFKKFRAHKVTILTSIMTYFVRTLRAPNFYALPVVFETLRSLSEHAGFVNLELMLEIFNELKKLATSHLQSTQYSGPIMLGSALAALELIKSSPASFPIETDMSWIGRVINQATKQTIMFLEEKSVETIERDPADEADDTLATICESAKICGEDFERALTKALLIRKAWGVQGVNVATLGVPPVVLETLVILCGSIVHSHQPALIDRVQKLVAHLLGYYPGLKSANDPEGVLISSLMPAQTIAWTTHLMKCTIGVGSPEMLSFASSIDALCK